MSTGEHIDLGHRLDKCIFIPPEEYADLIKQLEEARDGDALLKEHDSPDYTESVWFERGWQSAMDVAIQLIAQKANPPF